MPLTIAFDNSYAALPDRFYTRQAPVPVASAELLLLNHGLAAELGLDADELQSPEGLAMLAGNSAPEEAAPLAQVYAGHQFGNWVPRLGDGRALLLGEVVSPTGQRMDIQLKGSGQTPYSRMGDGRAWLGPVLREYIVSEAMHALGVPTTRGLAAVATGETVLREAPFPGAVLTRVAPSHIRVGTFQYFASQGDRDGLQTLTEHVMARHYPAAEDALHLLQQVVAAQARLVAQWMGFGFIHGVMNTDNAHVAGITIDYGPCAFMDRFDPGKVFSSIDRMGRYAYARQPDMAVWNMAQLATALLPLIDADQDAAIAKATEAVHSFPKIYNAAWQEVHGAKLGLATVQEGDDTLIHDLLLLMHEGQADFTNTFRTLAEGGPTRDQVTNRATFDDWHARWQTRLKQEPGSDSAKQDRMQQANPALIPRNHRIEEAITQALSGNLEPSYRLIAALSAPFASDRQYDDLRTPPSESEEVRQTFCGT